MQKKANIFSGIRQQANQQTGLQQSPGPPVPTTVRSSFDYLSNLERSPKAGGQNEPSKDLVPPSRAPMIMKSSFTKNSNINSNSKNWLSNSSAHFQLAQNNNDDNLLGSPTGHSRQSSQSLHGQFQLPSNNQKAPKYQYNQPSPILRQDQQSQQINKFQPKQAYIPSTLQLNPPTVQAQQAYSQIPYRSCARHSQESVKRVCSVYECKFPILLCGDCMYEDPDHTKVHQQQIILLHQFFELIDKEESKGKWKIAREWQLKELKGEGMRVLSNAEGITKEITSDLEMQKTKIKEEAVFLIAQFTQKVKDLESYHLQQLAARQQQCEDVSIKFREELNNAIRETEQQNHIPIRTYLQQHFTKNPDPKEVEAIFKSARDSLFARNPTDQSIVTQLQNLEAIKAKWQIMMQELTAMQASSGFVNIDKEEASKQILEMVQTIYRKNYYSNQTSSINHNNNTIIPNQQQQQYASFGSIPITLPQQYPSQPQQLQSQHSLQPSFNASNKEYLIENLLQGSASKDTVMTMTTEYDYNRNSNNPNVAVMSKKRSNTESEKKQQPSASYFQLSLKNDNNIGKEKDQLGEGDNGQKSDGNRNNNNISLPMRPSSSQSQSDGKKAQIATATVIKSNNSIPAVSLEKKSFPTKPALLESGQVQKKQSQSQSIQQSLPQQQPSLSVNIMNNPSLQNYPQSNQPQLHMIPELNVSSSVGSLFAQQLHAGTADSFQSCEVMEGSKVASIIQSGNSISLSQIPKEILLQNQPTPTCFCIIGDMVVACGDNLGVIKIYDLQTAQCIGARRINNDRNSQVRSILSMTYVFYEKQQQPLICCVTEDDKNSNNNGNTTAIDVCNVLDESKSFRLESSSLTESSSYENNNSNKNKQGSTLQISKINNSRSLSSRNGSASKIIGQGSQHNISPASFNTSSLVNMEDGRNILEQSNKRTINFWDISSRKSIASIQTEYDITSVLAMGREIASVLVALSTSEVVIYKVDYDSQVDSDEIVSGRIVNIKVLRKVAVGLQEASQSQGSVMLKLFNQKVLISVDQTVYVWNAASLIQEDSVQPYKYSNSAGSIIDLLAISSNECLHILCACQNDGFILLQPADAAAQGMKHHLKDFAFPANLKKNRLLMSKNSQNQLFLIALNASKASITFWRLNGETK